MYGLQLVDAHCQRALGTLSTWDQLYKQRATLYENNDEDKEERAGA
jgi:alpha,alpha-trehalase